MDTSTEQKMRDTIKIVSFTDKKIQALIPSLAALRIEVFAEYPFLYAGTLESEGEYLQKFMNMEEAIIVAAFDGEAIIGMSTGYPFRYEEKSFQRLFQDSARDPNNYFAFGESVLKKQYRGQGIGKMFFEERESHVQRLNCYPGICFYTIMRAPNDPQRPTDYFSPSHLWKQRGFVEHPELIGTVSYLEIGQAASTPKEMVFWIKESR